jgi:hypothetical protein
LGQALPSHLDSGCWLLLLWLLSCCHHSETWCMPILFQLHLWSLHTWLQHCFLRNIWWCHDRRCRYLIKLTSLLELLVYHKLMLGLHPNNVRMGGEYFSTIGNLKSMSLSCFSNNWNLI